MKFWTFFVSHILFGAYSEYAAMDNDLLNASLSTPMQCARDCTEGEQPKICYYYFTLEAYSTLGAACDRCLPSLTNTLTQECQCITSDGVERMVYSINRMIPGPSIQVCNGDKVVVDVLNNIQGEAVTIHFHGIKQRGSPYYDGVPFVTQCPIQTGNTFRYQFIAQDPGTHFYHSHSGLQNMNGLYGSLIIRDIPKNDENHNLYDLDLVTSVILISDTFHVLAEDRFPGKYRTRRGQFPANILINGKGRYTFTATNYTTHTPLEEFWVQPNYRYRFRLINGMCSTCPARLTIEDHSLKLIAIDGNPIKPVMVDSIISLGGERYDFVLRADKKPKPYWIQVKGLAGCARDGIQQLALIMYPNSDRQNLSSAPTYTAGLKEGIVLNPLDELCHDNRTDVVCLNQIKNQKEKNIILSLQAARPDFQYYLTFKSRDFKPEEFFTTSAGYKGFLASEDGSTSLIEFNNISFSNPPSPLISQFNDIPTEMLCNDEKKLDGCINNCTCTHVIKIPLNSVVEIVLIDEIGVADLHHPIHLHGYTFKVVAEGHTHEKSGRKITAERLKQLDKMGMIKRELKQTPYKDTLIIPTSGYAILRFVATNPGFWLLHCHFLFHALSGMGLVLWVGELSELPPVPDGFPRCGNFKPPINPLPNRDYFN